jgi:hypothetical protein
MQNEALEPLIGEWRIEMLLSGVDLPDVDARVTFEWRGDRAFVLERWTVPIPEAPDGLAVIRWDEGRESFLQHYFDERNVARVYEMGLEDGVWRLERTKPDFSPLDFSQRFVGRFDEDGDRIDGTWEIAHDHETWEKDFDLVYTRVRSH